MAPLLPRRSRPLPGYSFGSSGYDSSTNLFHASLNPTSVYHWNSLGLTWSGKCFLLASMVSVESSSFL